MPTMPACPAPFLRALALWLALAGHAFGQSSASPLPSLSVAAAPASAPAARAPASPPPAAKPPALSSDVFGAHLFTGAFAREGVALFNPDYLIATGDTLQVRMWGAFALDTLLVVDAQGNIFLPNVGPVPVRGLRNAQVQDAVESAVRSVFRSNVNTYASLAAAQPVRVFVSGFVQRPGLYGGTSMDSLLHYLDQAGGIDPDRGSFLAIQVQRNGQVRATVNLYEFLLQGRMPSIQLGTGDVIFVTARQNTVRVSGLVASANRFEFAEPAKPVTELVAMARPQADATHVRVVRNTGTIRNVESYPLEAVTSLTLRNGDELEFTADKRPGTITVRVEGEHSNPQEYVMPYGSRLQVLLSKIQPGADADTANLQLFRQSVRQRQRELLATSLRSLETTLLTARSGSSDEARLRKDEADLTLQWIERARQVEPLGQVYIAQSITKGDLLLENGDVLRIPRRDALVLVSGEVLFPNAVVHQTGMALNDYIQRSGGYTQSADASRVVIARRDGRFEQVDAQGWRVTAQVMPGDQLLVLPKVDEKNRQFWKDVTQIVYQIAVSAKVVLGL